MKRLIITGDPGIRKGGRIEHDGTEVVLFSVTRNGEWHGPEELQLWCIVGTEDERDAFENRDFIPHFLEVDTLDAEDVTVIEKKGSVAA